MRGNSGLQVALDMVLVENEKYINSQLRVHELEFRLDEARKLAEEWRNAACGDCDDDRPEDEILPWERGGR